LLSTELSRPLFGENVFLPAAQNELMLRTLERQFFSSRGIMIFMEQEAVKILKKIIYATVATSTATGEPWNSPVYIVYDDELNFYWASGKSSQHSRNIVENSRISIVVYDSTVPWGTGRGVFIEGRAREVVAIDEIVKACELRKARVTEAKYPPEEFLPDKPRSIYKVTPTKLWVNQDVRVDGYFVDERTELNLNMIRSLAISS
jgi:nitroimidazol reductase NimA-like FMN-containing flavoprotein (pyridoxamine 5'-phosphate oxidase superfamily)